MELYSPYIIALVSALLLSHVVKYIVASVGSGLDFKRKFFKSGGMPSAHTATAMAVWTVILYMDGWSSGLFGLASVVLVVVAYDAVTVRRSSGEQGEALKLLIKEQKSKVKMPRIAKGHTLAEMLGGIVLGLVVGAVVLIFTS